MSALFPNVPDVPGVPVVNRAPAAIQSAIVGATQSRLDAQTGLDLLGALDPSGALASFTSSGLSASTALVTIAPIFSEAANSYSSLSDAVGQATGAVEALGRGDFDAAIRSGLQIIGSTTDAIGSLREVLNPTGFDPLAQSGPQAQAEIAQQWGLYTQDGQPAAVVDNVSSLEALLEAQISDYPVENGGFASYNKVIRPFDIRLSMSRGGPVEDRQAFVKAIQDAWQSTDLFNVVTPEVVYLDVNVVGVRRLVESDRGVGLTMLDVALRKVRQTAKLSFADTKEPASAGTSNNGAVQTQKDFQYSGAVN